MKRKYQTSEDFIDEVQRDWAWRKHELCLIKEAIRCANEKINDTKKNKEIRAGIPLLYAHWEGFVKHVAVEFLRYVVERKFKKSELTENYTALMFRNRMLQCSDSRKIGPHVLLITDLLKNPDEIVSFDPERQISTASNLNYDRFKEILEILNLGDEEYRSREKQIDEVLLKNRNSIAHGEYLRISFDQSVGLFSDIISLIERFATDVQNLCATERFMVKKGERKVLR